MLRGDTGLIKSSGFNEVAHGLGLGQIDAAVEERAQREFARFGKARAGADGAVETMPQDDRRAVAGNLDDIFGGVRLRGREVRDDDFIDHLAFVVDQLAKGCAPGTDVAFERDDVAGDRG